MTLPPFDNRASAEELRESSRILFGAGLFLLVAGIFVYFWLAHLEAEGGILRAPFIFVMIYQWLGKEGIAALLLLASARSLYYGWREHAASKL